MARYRTPKYDAHVSRTAEQAASEYDKLAAHYERLAKDDAEFNASRRRQGKTGVPAIAAQMRVHKRRAAKARELAKKLRAGK